MERFLHLLCAIIRERSLELELGSRQNGKTRWCTFFQSISGRICRDIREAAEEGECWGGKLNIWEWQK